MSNEQAAQKRMIKVNLEGGRKNWVADFPTKTVRMHVEKLLNHHGKRLIDDEKAAKENRALLVEATRTAIIQDPNRTQVVVTEKQSIERAQAQLDGAVMKRKSTLGELARWMIFLKVKGDDSKLLLTIDDLAYFRMGDHDLGDSLDYDYDY